MKLIVGLGNPDGKYSKTYHNIGFMAIDKFVKKAGIEFDKKRCKSIVAKLGDVIFAKPLTYMNLSGESIIAIANFYKIKPDEVLVIHDELELPLGTISLKWSGGLGGHNGLRSTKGVFGTADFWRLRFGISKPINANIADYVLSNFTEDEQIVLSQIFSQVNELFAKLILSKEPQRLIQNWGKKKLIADTN